MSNAAPIGDALAHSIVQSLGSDCAAAAHFAHAVATRELGAFLDRDSLRIGPAAVVSRIAEDFGRRGWITPTNTGWMIGPNLAPSLLPAFLQGAAAMGNLFSDHGRAAAAITLPPSPSWIERALPTTGFAYASLLSTDDALRRVAAEAVNTLTLMTPFLNEEGLEYVISLAALSRAAVRKLIVRELGGARDLITSRANRVRSAGLEVLNYHLPTGDGFETFHAKVALADSDLAYVGSANLTVFARRSMDLGFVVDGKAARVVASVIKAVERVSVAVPLS